MSTTENVLRKVIEHSFVFRTFKSRQRKSDGGKTSEFNIQDDSRTLNVNVYIRVLIFINSSSRHCA